MSQTTYELLWNAMHLNDPKEFFAILESQNLPRDYYHDYELLTDAIKLGYKSIVLQLLDKGCRVTRPRSIESPLHLAVRRFSGWSNIVEMLVRRGARVSDVDADGNTPLHLAFLLGALDYTIDLLMEKFVEETHEDVCNKNGLGILHIACTRFNSKVVKDLLGDNSSDNLNWQVVSSSTSVYAGFTPLHFAVYFGRHDIAELLLDHNASIYVQDANNSTALHLALYRRDVDMIDLILSYGRCNWECVDNSGLSHLMAACAATNTVIAEEFLRKAASPVSLINARVKEFVDVPYAGYSPLHFAADFGRFLTVCMLVEYGASYIATQKRITPMMLAAKNRDDTTCFVLQKNYGCAAQ